MPVSKNRKGHKKKVAQRKQKKVQERAMKINRLKRIIEENRKKQEDEANEDRYEEE